MLLHSSFFLFFPYLYWLPRFWWNVFWKLLSGCFRKGSIFSSFKSYEKSNVFNSLWSAVWVSRTVLLKKQKKYWLYLETLHVRFQMCCFLYLLVPLWELNMTVEKCMLSALRGESSFLYTLNLIKSSSNPLEVSESWKVEDQV